MVPGAGEFIQSFELIVGLLAVSSAMAGQSPTESCARLACNGPYCSPCRSLGGSPDRVSRRPGGTRQHPLIERKDAIAFGLRDRQGVRGGLQRWFHAISGIVGVRWWLATFEAR